MTAAGFYHCSAKGVGRTKGRSIVAAAAYRSGERLNDDITGDVADYRARGGVHDSFILAPENAPDWAHGRERLWNQAELAETRANGRLATEFELALPHELTDAQRKELLTDYLRPLIEQHRVAADVAIHTPGEGRDHRNVHAHVLITHRTLDADGFGGIANERTAMKKVKGQEKATKIAGIAATPADIAAIRKGWEQATNRAYERAGLDIRVDHRSHADRGIAQEPTRHLGPTAADMERRGAESERGAANREITQRNAGRGEVAALETEATALTAEIIDLQAERDRRALFASAANRVTEPRAPMFDRDAAEAAHLEQVVTAAIAKLEAERAAGRDGPGGAGMPSASPEKSRPVAELEQKILDADRAAGGDRQKFEAALYKEGLALARVTAADMQGLEAARRDQELPRVTDEAYSPRILAQVREGELATVTKHGHVLHLNQHHLADIDRRHAEPVAGGQALAGEQTASLPSVTSAQAVFEADAHGRDQYWQAIRGAAAQGRADFAAAGWDRMDARERRQNLRTAAAAAERSVHSGFEVGARASSRVANSLSKIAESFLSVLSFFGGGPPKLTPHQAELAEKAHAERSQEQATEQSIADRMAQLDEKLEQIARTDAQERAIRHHRGGAGYDRPAELGDDDYQHERER